MDFCEATCVKGCGDTQELVRERTGIFWVSAIRTRAVPGIVPIVAELLTGVSQEDLLLPDMVLS